MQIIDMTYAWAGTLARRSATRRIILHHAAAVTCTAQQIHQWHLANGWSGIGYHFFVRKDGSVYRGRPQVQKHSDVNATGCPGGHFPFAEIAGAKAAGTEGAKPSAPTVSADGTKVTLPLLLQGSRGETVRLVQAALSGLGYDAGAADGIFGANTAAAVKRFQAGSALAADGIVGRDTWHKLLGA